MGGERHTQREKAVREGEKFGIECKRSANGAAHKNVTVTNYERLHYFDPNDFAGVVCDESSAIKHFGGEHQKEVTAFTRKVPYRLLCTATAAPNDYIELGTSGGARAGVSSNMGNRRSGAGSVLGLGRFAVPLIWDLMTENLRSRR